MAGFTGASPIVTDGLVFAVDAANYESYPGSGELVKDLSSVSSMSLNNMDVSNNPSNNYNSINGGVLEFDGSNEFLSISGTDFIPLHSYSNFTITGWFKPSSSQSSWVALFCYANSTNNYLTLQRNSSNSSMKLYHGGGDVNLGNIYSNVFSGNWGNITLTFSSGAVVVYLNGSQLASVSGINLGSPSSQFFRIFSERSTLTTAGAFSNLFIYNRTLSADEITQNYNALKSRFNL